MADQSSSYLVSVEGMPNVGLSAQPWDLGPDIHERILGKFFLL